MQNFKINKVEKLVITIRIDTEILKRIEKLSKDNKISRNKVIIQCCEYALKNMNK